MSTDERSEDRTSGHHDPRPIRPPRAGSSQIPNYGSCHKAHNFFGTKSEKGRPRFFPRGPRDVRDGRWSLAVEVVGATRARCPRWASRRWLACARARASSMTKRWLAITAAWPRSSSSVTSALTGAYSSTPFDLIELEQIQVDFTHSLHA